MWGKSALRLRLLIRLSSYLPKDTRLWCVYSQMNTDTHRRTPKSVRHTWLDAYTLLNTHARASPISSQGYSPPQRLTLCQCASRRPRLAVLISCFFDRLAESDSMICTPAQTRLATSIPTVMAGKRLGMSGTVFYTFGLKWRAACRWWAAASSVSHSTALRLASMKSVISCIQAGPTN